MRALSNTDAPTLSLLLELLGEKCPPAAVETAADMATEEGRCRLVFAAGRRSVYTDIEKILKLKERGDR